MLSGVIQGGALASEGAFAVNRLREESFHALQPLSLDSMFAAARLLVH